MQIKPVGMPKPATANQGGMMTGFQNGGSPSRNPLEFLSPFSTMSSSAIANRAATGATVSDSIIVFKTHYNKIGGTAQVKYVGADPQNMTIEQSQENLAIAAQYPLTEEQYNYLQQQQNKRDRGDDDPEIEKAAGSDMSWTEGVDWSDDAAVKKWTDETLAVSKGAQALSKFGLLGIFPGIVQGTDIARVRGAAQVFQKQGRTDLAEYMLNGAKEASDDSPFLSFLDSSRLMTGNGVFKNINNNEDILARFTTKPTTTISSAPPDKEEPTPKERGGGSDRKPFRSRDKDDTSVPAFAEGLPSIGSSGARGAGPTIVPKGNLDVGKEQESSVNVGGPGFRNKGGLMMATKKKKRGRPRKSGLAGKQ
jgi:type II secretory pathway pseudopilin PulG